MARHRISQIVLQFCTKENIPLTVMCDRLHTLKDKYETTLVLARLRDNTRDIDLATRRLSQISRVLSEVGA